MPDLTVTSRRTATLPNCDHCGRFTSHPTVIDECWSGGAGMFACSELLLCDRCADNHANKETKESRAGDAEDD